MGAAEKSEPFASELENLKPEEPVGREQAMKHDEMRRMIENKQAEDAEDSAKRQELKLAFFREVGGLKRSGVFEYILGGLQDTKLLNVRVFDDATKRSVYATQTTTAEASSTSNCPLCAVGHAANKRKTWKFADMDADHVSAWSKGGGSSAENCQMLCITHNRAKGNR